MKNLLVKLGQLTVALSFLVTMTNANRICFFGMNQPEIPESAKKFRKF